MPNRIKLTALVAAVIALSSCSSQPDPIDLGPIEQDFATQILADGTKLFRYTVLRPAAMGKAMSPNQHSSEPKAIDRRQRMTKDAENPLEAQLITLLEQALKKSAYCHDQYFELSRVVLRDRAEIRGECHEGATAEDRKNFPNN
ncbi:hypothetical protein JYB87_07635 [Shewanella avicenniae]|uniref:Lipoprotein n=1 Tax=Shewanella avicenniae TaxID=2814294 RepID=A0ABX7QWR4_9GAMM|nr:hypothetical protein [Shewanella avicenniae]QSX35078.1 hypothetical protein JYB87_07635 [Shewanella avicenniae]